MEQALKQNNQNYRHKIQILTIIRKIVIACIWFVWCKCPLKLFLVISPTNWIELDWFSMVFIISAFRLQFSSFIHCNIAVHRNRNWQKSHTYMVRQSNTVANSLNQKTKTKPIGISIGRISRFISTAYSIFVYSRWTDYSSIYIHMGPHTNCVRVDECVSVCMSCLCRTAHIAPPKILNRCVTVCRSIRHHIFFSFSCTQI